MDKNYSFIVIFNGSSGAQMPLADFKKVLKKYYPPPQYKFQIIEIGTNKDLDPLLKKAYQTCHNFVICGGDGTVRETIQKLVEYPDIQLTIIPLGTFNHFAKDIGQSVIIEEAVQAIMQKKTQSIDVGKVNDLYFVNVSSIGIYTQIAKHKQKLRKKGMSRFLAAIFSTQKAMRQLKTIEIKAKINNRIIHKKSVLALIGNNRYHLEKEKIGTRTALNKHQLHFFLLKKVSPFRLFSLIFNALWGNLKQQKEFDEYFAKEITIQSNQKSTLVSLDGEVYTLNFPLKYQMIPNKLKLKIFSPSENV